ncbi:hypothetical protein [Thauera humireducens]|uniref:hypothetical protein n=1 Tax=Thauera humireducens TaxID=1134435 RepID=UPI00311D3DAF
MGNGGAAGRARSLRTARADHRRRQCRSRHADHLAATLAGRRAVPRHPGGRDAQPVRRHPRTRPPSELLDASLGNDGRAEFDALLAAARETRQQMLAVVTSA